MPMAQGAALVTPSDPGFFRNFQLTMPQNRCKNRALRAPGTITRCPIDVSAPNFAVDVQTIPVEDCCQSVARPLRPLVTTVATVTTVTTASPLPVLPTDPALRLKNMPMARQEG